MTCAEIDSFFDPAGGHSADLPIAVVQHLAACQRCHDIHALLSGERIDLPEAPRSIQERILRELTAELVPVAPVSGYKRCGTLLLAVTFGTILVPTAMMHARALALMSVWQILAMAIILGGLAVTVAFSLACQSIPGSRHIMKPRGLIAGSLVFLLALLSAVFPWHHRAAGFFGGLRCLLVGLMIALPAAALLGVVLRRGVVLNPGVTSASLGLLGGLAAVIVLQLNCSIVEASHIIVWHLSVVLLMTVAGYLAGAAFGYRNIRRHPRAA